MTRITNYLKDKKGQKLLAEEKRRENYLKEKGILLTGDSVPKLMQATHTYEDAMLSGKGIINNQTFTRDVSKLNGETKEAFLSVLEREEQRVFLEIENDKNDTVDYKIITVIGGNLPLYNNQYYAEFPGRLDFVEQLKPQIVLRDADQKEVEIVKSAIAERAEIADRADKNILKDNDKDLSPEK